MMICLTVEAAFASDDLAGCALARPTGFGARKAGRLRAGLLMLAVLAMVGGCSDDKPATTGSTISPEQLKRECADPQWKEKNLGMWYSVCRQPLRW